MSSLESIIPFDRQGVLGPSLSILAFAGTYDPKQLMLVIKILQENAERVAHTSLHGRKEFIRSVQNSHPPMTAVQMVATRFFQGLQAPEPLPPTYAEIKRTIAPNTLVVTTSYLPYFKKLLAQEATKEALIEWLARVLSGYMTEEQVHYECRYQELVKVRPDIREKRIQYGQKIYRAVQEKILSKRGFDAVIWGLKHRTEYETCCDLVAWWQEVRRQAGGDEGFGQAILHIDNYLSLFSLAEGHANWFPAHICNMLEKIFSEKFFSQGEDSLFLRTSLFGPVGLVLSLLYDTNRLSIEQLTKIAKALKRTYTLMTGQEVHGTKLFCQMFEEARREGKEVSWEAIFSSRILSEMSPKKADPMLSELTERYIVPYSCYKEVKNPQSLVGEEQFNNESIKAILARMIQACMDPEDLRQEGELIRTLGAYSMAGYQERARLESEMYQAAWAGKLEETDLEILIMALQGEDPGGHWELAQSGVSGNMLDDKRSLLTAFIEGYQALFKATGLPYIRAHTVRILNIYFRETFFPGSAVIS